MAQVTVCCQINTKHINTVWAESTIVEMLNCWCITQQVSFKKLSVINSQLKYTQPQKHSLYIYIYIYTNTYIYMIMTHYKINLHERWLKPSDYHPNPNRHQIQIPLSHTLRNMLDKLMPTIMMLTLVSCCVPFDQLNGLVRQYIRATAEPSTQCRSIPLCIIDVLDCCFAILLIW